MDFKCFCGLQFSTVDQLYQHATLKGHRVRCSCGKLVRSDTQLKVHQRNAKHWDYEKLRALHGLPGSDGGSRAKYNHQSPKPQSSITATTTLACNFCGKPFGDAEALEQHKAAKHPSCPKCRKTFHDKFAKKIRSAQEQLRCHQQGTGHCYCSGHDITFKSEAEFEVHRLASHHDGYQKANNEHDHRPASIQDSAVGLDEYTGHHQVSKSSLDAELDQTNEAISLSVRNRSNYWHGESDDDSDASDCGGVSLQ